MEIELLVNEGARRGRASVASLAMPSTLPLLLLLPLLLSTVLLPGSVNSSLDRASSINRDGTIETSCCYCCFSAALHARRQRNDGFTCHSFFHQLSFIPTLCFGNLTFVSWADIRHIEVRSCFFMHLFVFAISPLVVIFSLFVYC